MRTPKNILLLLLLASSLLVTSQIDMTADSIKVVGEDREQIAIFPGGPKALSKYIYDNIGSNIVLTTEELTQYRKPYAKFIIDNKGYVDSVQIIRTSQITRVDCLFVAVLQKMPKWTPTKFGGKAKRQVFNLPLTICFK